MVGEIFVGFSCRAVGGIFATSSCMLARMVGAIRRPKRARSSIAESMGSAAVDEELGL